ncbi:MAG TPA: DUF4157 domain-containing protein, partial [Ramlibacter sp.]
APAAPQAGKPVQRQAAGTARPPVSETPGNAPSLPSELLPRLGGGEPLDAEARAFFEQRLGRDLSGVRVHTDDAAADAARSLQARAFTWGNHVAFASGEYQPASERGRTLIAHELAHVLQNESAGLRHVVARKDNPKYKDPNDISQDAFDPAEDKKKRPLMETLKLPAIKSRHADYYKKLAGKSLKRPAGYDRKKPPFQPEQVKKWKENVKLEAYYAGIGFAPGAGEHTLPFYGSPGQKISGKQAEVIERLQIPSWTPEGTWLKSALQVDHVVELQVGGHDEFYNYELLTGAHNMNVGSLLRGTIYAGVKGYLGAMGKNTGDKLVKDYLEKYDVEFKAVEGGGEGRHLEATSRFWARTEITAGKHLAWLKGEQVAQKKDGSDKSHFALYSYTGQAFIDAFPLNRNKVSVSDSGRLAGIRLGPNAIRLNPGFDKGSGGTVGSIKGTWELPKQVQAQEGKDFESPLNAVPNKPYAGSLSSLTPPKVDAKGASPVSFEQLDFVRGRLTADGILTTSHPLFPGIQIPVRWRGDDFAFEYTFQPTQLKLPVPGLTVDEASVTLFFGTRGVGADGMIAFTVAGLGSGLLTVGVSAGPKGPALNARGSFTADRKLFDLATLEIGYDSEKGFHGKGTLGITNPQKIKGIKSARLTAGYKDAVFSATGEVQPDIPGLKGASLSVSYGKDTLQITGKLGVDERVPGVQSADITVDVKQVDGQWKVAASGEVVPKLPGLSGATLKFSYDEGFVLVEGSFEVKKGPLHGKVQAGVTNAEVDAKGQRAATGAGKAFHVFGAADIDAEFIKNKLTGKLRLRLLPDGQVRVGGGLAIGDFEVFPQIPKQAEFFKKSIN